MKRWLFTPSLGAAAALLLSCGALNAQTVTWVGTGSYDGNNVAENWLGGVLPLNDGTEEFLFGPSSGWQSVTLYNNMFARKVSFVGNTTPFWLDDDYGNLTIGADGLLYAPATPLVSRIGAYTVIVSADQAWDIQSGALEIEYYMQGPGRITKTGAGTLIIFNNNNAAWTGGVDLVAGRVAIGPGGAGVPLGTGPLTFSGGTLIASSRLAYGSSSSDPVVVSNPIFSNGLIRTVNDNELEFDNVVTLNADTTIQSRGLPLYINNQITDGGNNYKLTIDAAGAVILDPSLNDLTNTYTGGTHVEKGVLIFGNEDGIPTTGSISVASLGYAGIADTGVTPASFLGKFDGPNTHGTIGFDTDPEFFFTPYEGAIDLTDFSSTARLGSATEAFLGSTALITPPSLDYRFGGGGGALIVQSLLTGPRNVVGDSPAALPLGVFFENTGNDFTGDVTATHTALSFAEGALPASAGLVLGPGGYISLGGTTALQDFIDRFPTNTNNGMIGLEGDFLTNIITANLELGAFTDRIYLGTARTGGTDDGVYGGLRLQGTITNAGTNPYRFGGYKGGLLRIESNLTGAAGMHIGDPDVPATFGDIVTQEISAVALMGDNSGLSGDTTLFGGQLYLGNINALGTGSLIVEGMPLPPEWQDENDFEELSAPELGTAYDLMFSNNITLNSSLGISEYSYLGLSGKISGIGELYLNEGARLTLSNDTNDFTGGIYLSRFTELHVDADHATGPGPLAFGGGSGITIYLGTANPVINGLKSSPDDFSFFYAEQPNTTLTINQSFDTHVNTSFDSIAPALNDTLRVVKTGVGTMRWRSGFLYPQFGTVEAGLPGSPQVGLEVQQGTLLIGSFARLSFSGPSIWVRPGATLAVDDNYTVENPLILETGSRLTGSGWFDSATIGNGAVIAPGFNDGMRPIGQLGFHDLTLAGGGIFEWNMQSPLGSPGTGWDLITVSTPLTLHITATAGDRFSLKAISLDMDGTPGVLNDIAHGDPTYSWLLFETESIVGFDPSKFLIDDSQFFTAAGSGTFSLSQVGSDLFLTFTPVPEPSTYVLMALGLGILSVGAWRRRKG